MWLDSWEIFTLGASPEALRPFVAPNTGVEGAESVPTGASGRLDGSACDRVICSSQHAHTTEALRAGGCEPWEIRCDQATECDPWDVRCGSQNQCDPWNVRCLDATSACDPGDTRCMKNTSCDSWDPYCEPPNDCGPWVTECSNMEGCLPWEVRCDSSEDRYTQLVTCFFVTQTMTGFEGECGAGFGANLSDCIVAPTLFASTDGRIDFLCASVGSGAISSRSEGVSLRDVSSRTYYDPVLIFCEESSLLKLSDSVCDVPTISSIEYSSCKRDNRFRSPSPGRSGYWYICEG
jgi:hypothetical protein